jgi:hypothetical protein
VTPRPPIRPSVIAATALLTAAAVLCAGFVHRGLQRRRSRAHRQERQLEAEAASERLDEEVARYRSFRQRRRQRGGGWDRGRFTELQSQHYTFDRGGHPVNRRLSASAIHAVLSRHDQAIGRCLIRHGAADVTIRFQILGTGRVTLVTTDLAGVAARCVQGVVQKVRFPARKGTRTPGTYRLRLR